MANPTPTLPTPTSAYGASARAWSWRRSLSPTGNLGDAIFRALLVGSALVLLLIVGAMIAAIALNSVPSMRAFGFGFLTSRAWNPIRGAFGALPFIYGTVVSSVIALIISVPLSLGVAVFLVEQAPRRLARPVTFLVELLAAIPSVVYGLWGIFVLAPFLREHIQPPLARWFGWLPLFQGTATGIGLLTGGIILAIMITPIIAAVVRDVLAAVPMSQREAALALGATKWETTRVVLANGGPGIAGAIILGLGRAIVRHGRDDVDRQSRADQSVALRAVVHHRVGARQRVHRGERRIVLERVDSARADSLPRDVCHQRRGAPPGVERDARHERHREGLKSKCQPPSRPPTPDAALRAP